VHRTEELRIDNPESRRQRLAWPRRPPPFDLEIDGRTQDAERRVIGHRRPGHARQRAQPRQRLVYEMALVRAGRVARRRQPKLRRKHVLRIDPPVHPQQAQRAPGGLRRADQQHGRQCHLYHDQQIARVLPSG
jgi:hypothetical protein